jgi:uncharacterized protein
VSMEIRQRVTVNAAVDDVWAMITDIPRIAPCIPGTELDRQLDATHYTGRVRVKVGPLALTLAGDLSVETIDPIARRIVLRGAGKDPRGLGHTDANVSISASPEGDATLLEIVSDVRLGGPVAQFGRQAIVTDIVKRMLRAFASCLGERMTTQRGTEPSEDRRR